MNAAEIENLVKVDLKEALGSAAEACEAHGIPHVHNVYIYNELNMKTYLFEAHDKTRVEAILDAFYRTIGRTPDPKDRITCEHECGPHDGEPVPRRHDLTLDQYLDEGFCPHLTWKFCGDTGGA